MTCSWLVHDLFMTCSWLVWFDYSFYQNLKNPILRPGDPKMADRVWKGYTPRFFGCSCKLLLNNFLIPGDGHLCYLISDWKEWIRVFCCPKVETVSLQESLDGTFWCHEFLRPMEKRNNEKNNDIRPFSCMLNRLKHIVCFHFNEWIKQNKTKHFCYLFLYLLLVNK